MLFIGHKSVDATDYNEEPDERSPATYITFIRVMTDGTSWSRVSEEEVVRTGSHTGGAS